MQSTQPTSHRFIRAEEAESLSGLFLRRTELTPESPAFHQFDRRRQQWITHSWREMRQRVARWQQGLARESLAPGDRVALLLANSVEWVCCEQAAMSLGLVVVPLYTWDSPENLAWLLADSGARLLLTGTWHQWGMLLPHVHLFPDLAKVLCLEEDVDANGPVPLVPVPTWLPREAEMEPPASLRPDDVATIVYTSGTTGPPKGVMLTHRNILWNAEALQQVVPSYPSDVLLSFLPLSHSFERTVGYYAPMMAGSSIAYVRSVKQLGEDLLAIRPTILISVPRIFEKLHARVEKRVAAKGVIARRLLELTVETGWQWFCYRQGRAPKPGLGTRILHPLLQRLVAKKIRDRLGGRLRFAASGGAPLQEPVARFLLSMGIPLLQGYGLTEAAPVISTNTLERNDPASVGPPLPGVQCRIGKDRELLVRSPGVMAGYWNRPEQSRQAVDSRGWLRTGDVVEIRDNMLYIRGRLKEILVTSTGEKVAPVDLETAIRADPLVEQVMVVGEGRPYIAALLVLRREPWHELAAELGIDGDDPASLRNEAATRAVLDRIGPRMRKFPAPARVRAVALLPEPWSIDNGLLTPTLKLRRRRIEQRFAGTIRELYGGQDIPG